MACLASSGRKGQFKWRVLLINSQSVAESSSKQKCVELRQNFIINWTVGKLNRESDISGIVRIKIAALQKVNLLGCEGGPDKR